MWKVFEKYCICLCSLVYFLIDSYVFLGDLTLPSTSKTEKLVLYKIDITVQQRQ